MIPLGLHHDEQKAFEKCLASDHEIRITARILTLEHKLVGQLTGHVLSGQVDVDTAQAVHRTASVTLLDPENELGIDTDTPFTAGAMASRMLQLFYGVYVPSMERWVDVPVFTGPIATTTRDGDVVTMTASGKEALLLDAACRNLTWTKGAQKTTILNSLLGSMGETFRSIPPRTDRITTNFTIASKEAVWPRATSLARSLTGGFQLGYDGRGYAELVDVTSNVAWTFKGGDGGSLLSEPKFTAETTGLKNVVYVHGGIPKGAKGAVWAIAHAPGAHPFSAKNLGRNGQPRYLREDIEDENITIKEAAQTLANNKLWELMQASTDAQFESLVIPHLEPWDYIRVQSDGYTFITSMQKFSIPLATDGRMTVGRHWATRRINGYSPRRPKNPAIPKPKKKPATPKKGATSKGTTPRKTTKKR